MSCRADGARSPILPPCAVLTRVGVQDVRRPGGGALGHHLGGKHHQSDHEPAHRAGHSPEEGEDHTPMVERLEQKQGREHSGACYRL